MASPDYAMETGPGAHWLRWFQRFVWLGIAANIVITLTAIFCTEWVIAILKLDPAFPLAWPRFGAFGILLLTGFYVVAAMDPCRSRWATVFTVICRFGGFAFFAIVGGRYVVFGLYDLLFGAPQAICLYLAWRRSKEAAGNGKPRGRWVVPLIVLLTLAAFAWGATKFFPTPIVPKYASEDENFKYGSIGNDGAAGVPYPIWVALPEVCARHLPPGGDGYASFGILWDRGVNRSLGQPIGFSRARVGVERMSINCAICHTVRARLTPEAEPQLYLGGAANTIDIQGYQRFLSNCAEDEVFSADNLIPVMDRMLKLGFAHKLLYRYALIPVVRKQLREQSAAFAWSKQRPIWGPGRIDPFNPVKFGMLKLADDGTIGNSDMLAVWNMGAREGKPKQATYHWDGLSTSLRDVVISSALGDGAVAAEFDFAAMRRVENYLRTLPPPASPHRPDPAAVERGKAAFKQHCAECHAGDGARTATVVPQTEVGTDIQRNFMWTEAAAQAYSNYREGYAWNLRSFRKVDGYLATNLDGLWLNGPYLHNGSVPTLRDLLKVPAERPVAFVRGGDVLDGRNGGFLSPPCVGGSSSPQGFCYDTRLVGNSNAGHLYGTALPAAEKEDLLAYLLTL